VLCTDVARALRRTSGVQVGCVDARLLRAMLGRTQSPPAMRGQILPDEWAQRCGECSVAVLKARGWCSSHSAFRETGLTL